MLVCKSEVVVSVREEVSRGKYYAIDLKRPSYGSILVMYIY